MNHEHPLGRIALALTLSAAMVAPALADGAADKAKAQKEIWAKEEAIYAGRGRGDIGPYVSFTADDYAAWPAGRPKPVDANALRTDGAKMAGKAQEKIRLEFIDFRLSGPTAVIYYRTHRSAMADGTPVDQQYDNTHTWTRAGDDWKIVGGLSRLVDTPAK